MNVVFFDMRARRRPSARFMQSADFSAYENATPSTPNDHRFDLEKAIANLPQQARIVLVLHDIEGYRHEEIGKLMRLSLGTSKAHLHRARKLLREALELGAVMILKCVYAIMLKPPCPPTKWPKSATILRPAPGAMPSTAD